jgi:hypothetical protein
MKKADKFPALYNNHLDLGRSSLLERKSYGKPDSVIYLDRLKAEYKERKGYVYFYKYKAKKDDLTWKLATVGLLPEDPKKFEFDEESKNSASRFVFSYYNTSSQNQYDFTSFTDTKIKDDEPITDQLKKALKKILYSHRKSAKQFYNDENDRNDDNDYVD